MREHRIDLTTSAAIVIGLGDVARPNTELVKEFLANLLAPVGGAAPHALAHSVVKWQQARVGRAQRLLERAASMVVEMGAVPRTVPARLLMPILERGSLEEDEELSERWAALLANASAKPDVVLPGFATILAELSPIEARILGRLHTVQEQEWHLEVSSSPPQLLPQEVLNGCTTNGLLRDFGPFPVTATLCNLQRLSFLVSDPVPVGTVPEEGRLRLTSFGDEFMTICSPRTAATPVDLLRHSLT